MKHTIWIKVFKDKRDPVECHAAWHVWHPYFEEWIPSPFFASVPASVVISAIKRHNPGYSVLIEGPIPPANPGLAAVMSEFFKV
jgi:hypothetical protein